MIDSNRLRTIVTELQAMATGADEDTTRRLGLATHYIQMAADTPFQWPPTHLLAEMLNTGRDTWIADLLGCTRSAVRWKRTMLGVDPYDRGGSIHETRTEMERWLAEWRPKLAAAGWQPTKQAG